VQSLSCSFGRWAEKGLEISVGGFVRRAAAVTSNVPFPGGAAAHQPGIKIFEPRTKDDDRLVSQSVWLVGESSFS
jgi:hypothetical protein